MRELKIKYIPIKYSLPLKKYIPKEVIYIHCLLHAYFLSNKKKFEVFYLDESTISENNYKNFIWANRNRKFCTLNIISYRKLKIIGMITREKIKTIQFIKGSFNH